MHKKASLWGAFFTLWMLCPVAATAAETVAVRQVVDGDSLQLADGRKIRLVGVNAPEMGRQGRPDQPLALAAKQALKDLLAGRPAHLRFGPDRYDHHGRTLAYVDNASGVSAGEHLLGQGLAVLIAIPPNLDHIGRYRVIEAGARQARRGIWADPYYRPIPANQLGPKDTGFRFVTGTVERVGQSRKYVYFDLSADFAVAISRDNWHYFGGDPKNWKGKRVQVRGWISLWRDKLRVRVGHPAMVEILK